MSQPIIFISRSYGDSRKLADILRLRGFDPVVAPLLDIEFLPLDPLVLDHVQGFICTSRYGVQALSQATSIRDMPLYAVGSATAQAAQSLGFTHVITGAGDARALADLIYARCHPSQGDLIHISGQHIAQDMQALLKSKNFVIHRHIAYVAHAVKQWPAEIIDRLKQGRPGVVLLFSPRSAALFVDIIRQEKSESVCSSLHAVCFSRPVAEACLEDSGASLPLPWKGVWISPQPQLDTLLGIVDCLFPQRTLGLLD